MRVYRWCDVFSSVCVCRWCDVFSRVCVGGVMFSAVCVCVCVKVV